MQLYYLDWADRDIVNSDSICQNELSSTNIKNVISISKSKVQSPYLPCKRKKKDFNWIVLL